MFNLGVSAEVLRHIERSRAANLDFHDRDDKTISATSDAGLGSPGAIESQMRLRLRAGGAAVQGVIEQCVAEAASAKSRQLSPEMLKPIE